MICPKMTGSLRWRPSAVSLAFLFATMVNVCSWPVDNLIPSDEIQESEGPVINPPQNEIVLQKGQNFTLYCKSKYEVQFKQQEILEDTPYEMTVGSFQMVTENGVSGDAARAHEARLRLLHVDEFAVGYYACFDSTVNGSGVLANLIKEPVNTAHISYIYIYVNGTDTLFAPMREVIIARGGANVIECKPTSPDINVTLLVEPPPEQYSPKIGFVIDSDSLLDGLTMPGCEFTGPSKTVIKEVYVHKSGGARPPRPKVSSESKYFLEGETFSLNCTVPYQSNSAVMISWKTPRHEQDNKIIETNEQNVTDGIQYLSLTIVNATGKDVGRYTCVSTNAIGEETANYDKVMLDGGFINLTKENDITPLIARTSPFVLWVKINDYPKAVYIFYKNGKELLIRGNPKYNLASRFHGSSISLAIKNITVHDSANYTLVAKNKYVQESINFDVRVLAAPSVDFGPDADKRYLVNSAVTLMCDVVGYPLPEVKWYFRPFYNQSLLIENKDKREVILSPYKITSYLKIYKVSNSGNITCEAVNDKGRKAISRRFLVYEMPNGFGIENNKKTWFSEKDNVVLRCLASVHDFENVSWAGENEDLDVYEEESVNTFSHVAKLSLNYISLDQSGNYTCVGTRKNGTIESETISITVAGTRRPAINEPAMNMDIEVFPYQPLQLSCMVESVPQSTVQWYRDGNLIVSDSNVNIITEAMNHTTVNSTIIILKMLDEYKGKYECDAVNLEGTQERFFNILLKEKSPFKLMHLSIIFVIFVILLILVIYLFWKIKKEKQFRKELAAAGLLYFKEGVTKSLNPDLGIDEQAELLPYDDKFEFPSDKLKLGYQLGAGAFGVVYKAEARGIINAEQTTTVAVKMVKKTADNMYIKALASELKIMVHLGKHINIVNLLGACTKNVGKRELIVIVEYCRFGNIHNYMQKHREVFIDQFSDDKEKNFGRVNRGFSCSKSDSGSVSDDSSPQPHSEKERNQSDYFGSNHTPDTGHTFLNTANTNRSSRKVSETGYVQPEWRSNYESDYSYDGRSPRPLCSRDLLCWAFQIARGMEYLASRKVLHGDLAARNILLADDNVVKICDFGLARSIYKNDEYQQKGSNPVPVKWLAVECLTDRIFSTQSDVWAFGVVLWELFTLAKTPYPSISHTNLLQFLSDGNRLDKPAYSDDRLYTLMRRCWEQKPTARPTFSQLQETLGSYLEDNVRNHYVDLNAGFMDTNMTKKAEQEDYLAMVCAPDYNNLITPSPHHYVNDAKSFFPPTPTPQLEHDDEGYLQMNPAKNQTLYISRSPGVKFDYDTRRHAPESHAPELTPMLGGQQPARGSDSDLEDRASPYLNMCPRIDEESDEVFHNKNNLNNITQNGAVTNPTYITFDADLEKKPQDAKVCNSYVNMNVPSALVN